MTMATNDKKEVMFYSDRRRAELTVKYVILVDEQGKEYFYRDNQLFESNDESARPVGGDFNQMDAFSDLYDETIDLIAELSFEQLKKVYKKVMGKEYQYSQGDNLDCEDSVFDGLGSLSYDDLVEANGFVRKVGLSM